MDYHGVDQNFLLKTSIVGAKWFGMMGQDQLEKRTRDRIMKAVFKEDQFWRRIERTFNAVHTLPTRQGRPFTIKCANGPADVQYLDPGLWDYCRRGAVTKFCTRTDPEITLVICPGFFDLPEENGLQPRPNTCPDIQNNRFVKNSRHTPFTLTRAIMMFFNAVSYYGGVTMDASIKPNADLWLDWDAILGYNADTAADSVSSYLLFAERRFSSLTLMPSV